MNEQSNHLTKQTRMLYQLYASLFLAVGFRGSGALACKETVIQELLFSNILLKKRFWTRVNKIPIDQMFGKTILTLQ